MRHAHPASPASAWNPGIRGILVVLDRRRRAHAARSTCCSPPTSGARLGLLVALAGLFGWLVDPDASSGGSPAGHRPQGHSPTWKPVEIFVNDGDARPPAPRSLGTLPSPSELPTPGQIIADAPRAAEGLPRPAPGDAHRPRRASHPDIARPSTSPSERPRRLAHRAGLVGRRGAGRGRRRARRRPAASSRPPPTTRSSTSFEYRRQAEPRRVLPRRGASAQPDPRRRHLPDPVQVRQAAELQAPAALRRRAGAAGHPAGDRPGEAPPLPIVDPTKPVVSVVLVRDLGNVRLIPVALLRDLLHPVHRLRR